MGRLGLNPVNFGSLLHTFVTFAHLIALLSLCALCHFRTLMTVRLPWTGLNVRQASLDWALTSVRLPAVNYDRQASRGE